ncbi:uncharacterized protein IWZ02DRAFT_197960 [Phyllosticta citriasiana]|uniref:uncharacterized protein n=1 Tax=Phyllosticta citriasiana TaxID=595635 RepID=UPI0030FDD42E
MRATSGLFFFFFFFLASTAHADGDQTGIPCSRRGAGIECRDTSVRPTQHPSPIMNTPSLGTACTWRRHDAISKHQNSNPIMRARCFSIFPFEPASTRIVERTRCMQRQKTASPATFRVQTSCAGFTPQLDLRAERRLRRVRLLSSRVSTDVPEECHDTSFPSRESAAAGYSN